MLQWLRDHGIEFVECYDFWQDCYIEMLYRGSIYLDLPYEPGNPLYDMIEKYFENPDGSMKIPGVTLNLLKLEVAQRNAHYDDEGEL